MAQLVQRQPGPALRLARKGFIAVRQSISGLCLSQIRRFSRLRPVDFGDERVTVTLVRYSNHSKLIAEKLHRKAPNSLRSCKRPVQPPRDHLPFLMGRSDSHPVVTEFLLRHPVTVVDDFDRVGLENHHDLGSVCVVRVLDEFRQRDVRSANKTFAQLPKQSRVNREFDAAREFDVHHVSLRLTFTHLS